MVDYVRLYFFQGEGCGGVRQSVRERCGVCQSVRQKRKKITTEERKETEVRWEGNDRKGGRRQQNHLNHSCENPL